MNGLQKMALLSIAAAIVTLVMKFGAFYLTGSVSLFSDAAESLVNLAAGLMAFWMLTIAARPADAGHAYGHDKAEYFSSGVEGALILVAAISIVYAAVERFIHPAPLSHLGPGLLVSGLAALVNLAVARMLLKAARKHDSITLEADARHLLTDVWTSVGVLGGLAVIMFAPPAWQVLDPIMAVAVALNIVLTGVSLLRRSLDGLMDAALPEQEIRSIEAIISAALPTGASFHDLRSRKAGPRRFAEFHLLVPGETSVRVSHELCDRIEDAIGRELVQISVIIHVEPTETHSGESS
ncbi:MAG: cation diffusion facilitator family transporter [Sulfurimicrobium sp.]|jgi:cation diffusion facilitator family transporter|nr:cation diffusion facilitator family transporter [Sulfurimicrobium sp.]